MELSISEFFEKVLGANLANRQWSWGASNPLTNRIFLRVWVDQLESVDGITRVSILDSVSKTRSNGYPERKRHIDEVQKGVEAYGVLCTAKSITIDGKREIDSFDGDNLLKLGRIIEDHRRIYAEVVGRIAVARLVQNQTSQSTLASDLKSINARRIDPTTKETLINARVGQGLFRAQVLTMWNSQCSVTGSTTLSAIRASHIKPWRDSTDSERLDPYNGLPLVATFDALFDAGLITFAEDGRLIVSSNLSNRERALLGISDQGLTKTPGEQTRGFLEYHRNHVFRNGETLRADCE